MKGVAVSERSLMEGPAEREGPCDEVERVRWALSEGGAEGWCSVPAACSLKGTLVYEGRGGLDWSGLGSAARQGCGCREDPGEFPGPDLVFLAGASYAKHRGSDMCRVGISFSTRMDWPYTLVAFRECLYVRSAARFLQGSQLHEGPSSS